MPITPKIRFCKQWEKWIVYYHTTWGQTKLVSTHDTQEQAKMAMSKIS